MPAANTPKSYGAVAKSLHWLTVVLIFTVIPLGIVAHNLPYATSEEIAQKAALFSVHKTIGVAIFLLALLRVVWAVVQPKPGLLNADKMLEARLAQTIHWVLYACLLLVPLTGWIHHSATTGFAPIRWPFGQSLPFVPKDEGVAQLFAGLHIVFERVLVAALLLHIAGALKHHFVDRDATLKRMLPGRTEAAAPATEAREGWLPVGAAAAIFACAIAVGAWLGVYSQESTAAQVAELEAVETGWTVEEGQLGITIQQLGSEVEGAFGEWTAAIEFAEEPDIDGRHGSVEVTIAIGSLTLGSVTDQAMGADYFDAATFPTATFAGEIRADSGEGYVADGTLTLKGAEVPVALPFVLAIDGDTATMEGTTTLDRRDYGIGDNQGDANTLGFTVEVAVALTATRATE